MSEDKKGISWGGLIKGLVATAAVVAGAELMFPGFIEGIVEKAGELKDWIAGKFTATPEILGPMTAEQAAEKAAAEAASAKFADSIKSVAKFVGGAVLAVSGLKYVLSEKQEAEPEQESFAVREDMKRTQALMIARMRAQGYQPAMATAGQQR
ncbi:MAG: hypothetical protein ACK502_04385 [Alphaproteobacteria bacterium]